MSPAGNAKNAFLPMRFVPNPFYRQAPIVMGWLLVNGFFLVKNGIYTSGEAGKYIYEAHYLLDNGHLGSGNFLFYSVVIFLLSACIKLHCGFAWIIAIQGALALAATLSFHKTLVAVLRSPIAASAGTILLLLNLPYQALNSSLQTESLFHSMSLLLICSFVRQNAWSGRFLAMMTLFLLVLSVIRPTGLLYWPLAGIYFFLFSKSSTTLKLIAAGLTCLAMLSVINFAMNSGGDFDFTLPFREEHIICGSPTLLSPKTSPVSDSNSTLFSLLDFIAHDFRNFIRLAGLKTLSFWGVYRSYYSAGHNRYLALFFYPIIILALISFPWWKRRGQISSFLFLATPVAVTWITVILSCDDWSNRFFLGISPFLIFLAVGVIPGFRRE